MKSRSSRKKHSTKPYRVGRSRSGLGLFATEPIKKGEIIARYWGRRVPTKIADDIGTKYMFEVNSRWTIDGSTRRNTARYINHGCRPNAESDIIKGNVFIRATKRIHPGDEITYHYGKDYFAIFIEPLGCKCQACVEKRRRKRAEARNGNGRHHGGNGKAKRNGKHANGARSNGLNGHGR